MKGEGTEGSGASPNFVAQPREVISHMNIFNPFTAELSG